MTKLSFIAICIVILGQSFCISHSSNKVENPKHSAHLKTGTTLDSLQGVWYPEGDHGNGYVTISGNDYVVYTGMSPNTYAKIYFSNIEITGDDWTNITNVDTTATSGSYLILRYLDGNAVICYDILSVYDDGISEKALSLQEITTPHRKVTYEGNY